MATGGGNGNGKGYGRGGRGLAILEALKKEQAQAPGQAPGGGRGALLSLGRGGVLDKPTQPPLAAAGHVATPQSSQPQPAAAAPRPAIGGRGNLAGLLAMVQSGQSKGLGGRGGLLAQAAAAKPDSARPTSSGPAAAPVAAPVAAAPVAAPVAAQQSAGGEPAAVAGAMARMNIEDRPPRERRPTVTRRGTGGEASNLAVNYIMLDGSTADIFQYHVYFEPVVDSKSLKVGLLNEHKELLPVKLFDGNILYLPQKLPNDETPLTSTRRTDGATIKLLVKFTRALPVVQCPQLYNILIRKVMSTLNLCQVGRYYYNPRTPSSVPQHKLEVWPGYITSIQEQEGGLMLLLDSSHRVLRTQTVYDLLKELIQTRRSSFQQEATKQLLGCTVLTRYNNKTYRVDDIDWGKTPQNTFETSSGQQITFAEYYRNQYGKEVDPQQPLLINRPKATKIGGRLVQPRTELICLIPELCYLSGLTDDLRQNFKVMKDLSAHTRCTPNQRLANMKKFVDSINKTPEARQLLDNWGLRLSSSAMAVEGRKMATENIYFGNGRMVSAGPEADWGRDLTRNRVITPVNLENWAIFFVRNNTNEVNNFVQEVMKCAPQLGIQVRMPTQVVLPDDKVDTLVRSLRSSVNPRTQMITVVMPTSREDKYSAIKKFACVDCPVPSQVIVHKTIKKDASKLRSVVQKIVLQMNCKLGGELWAVKNPLETVMVVGIDSFHDVGRGRRSIGGYVASSNPELTRWYSKVSIQMQGEELVPGLRLFMVCAIRKYYENNHKRPEKIIVYRDGVGDGQMAVVQDYEVRQIADSFKDFGADYQPKLTVVIVQKRINTRIFQQVQRGSHLDNPPPGTVLDHTVTRRDMYDFFVVSQHVRQGTVSPTHYVVVHDEIGLPPGRMQVFTYKMTHLYYNWPGTVRVPAPCLYAHKLAYLVGESIHKEVSEQLSNRLFFL